MRLVSVCSILALTLTSLAACTERPSERSTARTLLTAQICAIAEDEPVAATDLDFAAKTVAPSLAIDVVDPGPVEPPVEPPAGEDPVCCLNGPCVPMDPPPVACNEPTDATLLEAYQVGTYLGPKIPTAIFPGCEDPDEDQCEEGDGQPKHTNGGDLLGFVEFDDEQAQTTFRYYAESYPGTYALARSGIPHAVVRADHSFANLDAPVIIDGVVVGFINKQTDCAPDVCGQTCSVC